MTCWPQPRTSSCLIYFPKDPALINTYYISGGTGTSFASPQMVGAAVLLKQIDPSFTPQQIIQILRDSGTMVTDATTGNSFPLLNSTPRSSWPRARPTRS